MTSLNNKKIRVTILYPWSESADFDLDYYMESHIPMIAAMLGDALIDVTVDSGVVGVSMAEPPPFIAIGGLLFDSLSAFENCFLGNITDIMTDVPNFTDIEPVVQISEVKA